MRPQFYSIIKGNQILFVLGSAAHSYDITHPQFKFIQDKWQGFLEKTKGKNCTVLVEGGKRPVINDLEEAIRQAAEGGFITSLAAKSGVEITSPEPDEVDEVDSLLKKFSKDQIMFYYFNRLVIQWHNANKPMGFKAYIQRYLDNYKYILNWKNYDFSIDHFKKMDGQSNAYKEVEAASVKIRDDYILKKSFELWESGQNIFIVYGGGHTQNWEKKLRTLNF